MRWFSESRGSAAAAAVVAVGNGARPDTIPFGAGWGWARWLGARWGRVTSNPVLTSGTWRWFWSLRWFSESRGSAAAAAVVAVASGARPDTIPFGAGWGWRRWLGARWGRVVSNPVLTSWFWRWF